MSNSISKYLSKSIVISSPNIYRVLGKRVFDISVTFLALPIILPIIVCLAILVALNGGIPFCSQFRIGKNRRVYRIWRLRSAVRDPGGRSERHRNRDVVSDSSSMKDSHLTMLGSFLRKTSLDQLPVIYSVLIGDMSLVGPRPLMISQIARYSGRDYYDLRPGLSGPWQFSTQHHMSISDHAICDTQYNQTLSFKKDLMILVATLKAALRRSQERL